MEYDRKEAYLILERTPRVLHACLNGLPESWLQENEGEGTWSPFDVVGHLIHGEKTDWVVRANHILQRDQDAFIPYDRFAQLNDNVGRSMSELLTEFEQLRAANLVCLRDMDLSIANLSLTGLHPGLGIVTLRQLLSAWVVHDLGHIAQISRVMAKHYKQEVGPWTAYLGILS